MRKIVQLIAAILALSGALHIFHAIFAVIFIPGFIVWFGWILISFKETKIDGFLFWTISAVWNAFALYMLNEMSGPYSEIKEPLVIHAFYHLWAAIILSVMIAILRIFKSKSTEQVGPHNSGSSAASA